MPLGAHRDRPDGACMAAQNLCASSTGKLPQAECPIGAPTHQQFVCLAKGHGIYGIRMSGQRHKQPSALQIPEADGPVAATAGNGSAIGADGNAMDETCMARKTPKQ